MLRASVTAEAAGIPSVSVVCEGFQRQGLATGRGLGFDSLPIAVLRGHVDSQSVDEMIQAFHEITIPQIVRGLTESIAINADTRLEPAALDVVVRGNIDEVQEEFHRRGWTDGLPFVPPTHSRVEAFLGVTGHDPWRVVGTARPSGRDMTVWSIAVNAVMAGCLPEHLPVLLAIAEAFHDRNYGVEHSGNTTGADALVILNGPVIDVLAFNHGAGALREGTRANTSVGRWLRLYLRNVCDFTADEHDKATFGNSMHTVLAEDEAALREIGWPSLCSDFSMATGTDAITIARMNSGVIIGSVFGSTPEEILPYLADGLVRVSGWDLTHNHGLGSGQFRPLLVLSPLLARTIGRAGWSRDDLREALFAHARIPAWKFEAYVGAWTNLTSGRRRLHDLVAEGHMPAVFAEGDDPNRLVPIVTEPSKFLIAVAGDPNRANAYAMSNDGPHGYWTSKPIDRGYSTDLVCRV